MGCLEVLSWSLHGRSGHIGRSLGQWSRVQVVYLATPHSIAVVKRSSTSDVLLLLKTELMTFTEVEDGG
jgi:hypothetical protein